MEEENKNKEESKNGKKSRIRQWEFTELSRWQMAVEALIEEMAASMQ